MESGIERLARPEKMTANLLIRVAKKITPAGTGVRFRSLMGPLVLGGRITRSLPVGCDKLALTFDDGPHPEHTRRVLQILDRWDIKATFFVVGREAERYPDVVHAIDAAGHEIGSHTHSHPAELARLPLRNVVDEIQRGNQALAAITGTPPRLFRPPYGVQTFRVLWACRRTGMKPIFWSHDSLDSTDRPQSPGAFLESACPGQIVLFHDNRAACPELLEAVLPDLVKRGHGFTSVGASF
jgi:peptidoglycan/xylan/chitin deacetylase (PgdA/CDA1 family)